MRERERERERERSKIRVKFHSLACGHPVFTVLFIKEVNISPLCILGTLVEN